MTSDILDEIKKEILAKLPKDTQVTKVEFEGPEVVVYTKNPQVITENGDLVRSLAKELRKRIIIRSDKSALLGPEETINKIHEIVPEGAEITDIYFDTVTGEVVITAKKPGLVIGKYGATSRNIVKNTGWAPKILRTPPISSDVIGKIRTTLKNSSKDRKKGNKRRMDMSGMWIEKLQIYFHMRLWIFKTLRLKKRIKEIIRVKSRVSSIFFAKKLKM